MVGCKVCEVLLKCDQLMTVFLLQVVHQWPDLLKGVKFDPSNQELIWHLLAKHGKSGKNPIRSLTSSFQQLKKMKASGTLRQKLPGTSIFFLKDCGIFRIKVRNYKLLFQIRSNLKIYSSQLLSSAYLC